MWWQPMSDTCICPECLVARPRILFSDGVCHVCAGIEINPFSHRAVTTKPAPVKTPEQAKKQQQQALRLQAEKERVEKERQEAFDKEQEAKRELAKREAARRNLLPFVMYFNEDYTPGWVHADICQRLEQFSKDVVAKKSPRLMLFCPPRSGKTELASKTFPAWHLGHNPNHDVICCSYSASLAVDISRKARGIIQDERYQNIFPETSMDESSQSAERWNTSAGGGYVAAGVQGPITGRGGHVITIDDIFRDREAAESENNRQAIKDWYSSTLYTRLAPGGGILVIMTRWHSDDLGGWLLEQMKEAEQEMAETGEWPSDADRWEVVRYPAIATHDEEYRKSGEALHPERYPLKSLNRIKRTLIPRDWEALYQQNPVSADGDYFKKDNFMLYDTTPPLETLRIYAAWDLAIGQKTTNDFTCGVVVGIDRSNDIWVLHRYYGRWGSDQLIQQFFECQRVWNPILQGIEHGQIEMTLEPFILKEMAEKKQKFNYIKLKTRGNDKMTRARPIQGRMEQSRVHFPRNSPWFQEMQNEMLAFPSGKHDDQVDALAWIGQMILMLTPQREKKPPAKKGWRDKLRAENRLTNTSGTSHMAS
jgi:predicted phage terminase large subunit-like protein